MNSIIKNLEKDTSIFIIVFLTLLYLLFPTSNSTIDGYFYGYSIKWGEELFAPHHLLYNFTYYIFYRFYTFFGVNTDALQFSKYLNALAGGGILLVLQRIFKHYGLNNMRISVLIFFTGSSFGIARFATENETYILPILISLTGFLYLLKWEKDSSTKNILVCSFLNCFACLYHQIHFFWWLGVLVSVVIHHKELKSSFKFIAIYSITAVIVPIIYYIVFFFQSTSTNNAISFLKFVFHDFVQGNVDSDFGFKNIVLGIINFVRTFYQIHGKMYYLIKSYPFLILIVIIVLFLFYKICFPFQKISFKTRQKLSLSAMLIIGLLQFLFAIYAVGNAEFMVLFPVIIAIIFSFTDFPSFKLSLISFSMLLWNFFLGVIPDSFINFSNTPFLVKYISEHQNIDFVLTNAIHLSNIFYYQKHYYPNNIFKLSEKNIISLDSIIHNSIINHRIICTDFINNKEAISRESILRNEKMTMFFKKYKVSKLDSFSTFYGTRKLYQIDEY